jgi:hypothetical protein
MPVLKDKNTSFDLLEIISEIDYRSRKKSSISIVAMGLRQYEGENP